MSDKITLETYPKNIQESLILLYLKNQNAAYSNPAELVESYFDTQEKIQAAFSAHYDQVRERRQSSRF